MQEIVLIKIYKYDKHYFSLQFLYNGQKKLFNMNNEITKQNIIQHGIQNIQNL